MKPGAHVVLYRLLETRGKPVPAVLLVKRTLDAPYDPGDWGLVGGTIDGDETAMAAVIREAWEEIGIALNPRILVPLCECSVHRGTESALVTFWRYPLDRDMDSLQLRRQERKGQEAIGKVEGEGIAWFTADEVSTPFKVRGQDVEAVNRFFAVLKGPDASPAR